MLINLARFFLRLIILFVAVFFVFYFYVLNYRFDNNVGFVKTSGVYSLEKLDLPNNEKIILNGKTFTLTDNKIILHNSFGRKSCGDLKIGDYEKYLCYKDNDNHIVYISKNIIKLKKVSTSFYKKIKLYKNTNPFIKYTFSWQGIDFIYYKNGDIVYKDSISAKKLINLKKLEFVGYSEKGFYVIKNNQLYFMSLVN